MEISIVLPTLNRDQYLNDVIVDLLNQSSDYSFEIIVVDQNNRPLQERNKSLYLLSQREPITWIDFPGKNVVLARNKGIKIAKGKIIIFLDDDIRIEDRNFLNKHKKAYSGEFRNAAAICGRQINPRGGNFINSLDYDRKSDLSDVFFFPRNYTKKIKATILATGNCSLKKKALLDIGCFDESFMGAAQGEDADLALRLKEKGYEIVYDPSPAVLHLFASRGGLRFSDKENFFSYSDKSISLWVFYFKHIHGKNTGFARHYIYRGILRKTLLLRANLIDPLRLPAVFLGLVKGFFIARRILAWNRKDNCIL